jgi:hypothetical protein
VILSLQAWQRYWDSTYLNAESEDLDAAAAFLNAPAKEGEPSITEASSGDEMAFKVRTPLPDLASDRTDSTGDNGRHQSKGQLTNWETKY